MKITILCVGKIKEKYFRDAIAEYEKRLGRYCKLEIVEVADEKTPERLLKYLEGKNCYVIALAINGKMLDSVALSEKVSDLMVKGNSHIVLVIGGSLGIADEVLKRADEKISFSKMTFPHQLMRVILLEQLYRSYRIINHEPYHK